MDKHGISMTYLLWDIYRIQYVMRKIQTESAKQQGIETVMKYNFMWDRYGIKFIVRQPGHTVRCEAIMQYSSY
jgi:hypothetical protein